MSGDSSSPLPESVDSALVTEVRYFHPQKIGESFRKLATDIVKGEKTDVVSRWFRSEITEADLVIWTDTEGRIIKHQLCLFGQVLEWTPIEGTRTGYVYEEEMAQGQESEIIRFDQKIDRSAVAKAVSVLAHVPGLSDSEREAMIYHLKQSPKLHKRARERALDTWSLKDSELTTESRPTFWKTVAGWIKNRGKL